MTDTIYALATAYGQAGIAVVRVSGPGAFVSLDKLVDVRPTARMATLKTLTNPNNDTVIDEAVVLTFPGPNSYTGEDVVEYHIHGGTAVRESLFAALTMMDGHRMAEAGEFTRRAFENGRMDLTQAEAVADLIHAETEAQKQQALSQMGGALSDLYQGWAERLVRALAYAEAQIDFSEEDLPDEEVKSHIHPVLQSIAAEIKDHLNDGNRGEILRDGIKIAVIGAPNAGKSSLVNALAKRDVAIVSDMAGTTRDVLEVHLNIGGYPVTLYDTAGLRPEQLSNTDAQHTIEAEGIKRALQKAQEADFKILLFDGTEAELHPQTLALADNRSLIVVNKMDVLNKDRLPRESGDPGQQSLDPRSSRGRQIYVSTLMGEGLDTLIQTVSRETMTLIDQDRSTPSLTRARHREALEAALEHIQTALNNNLTPDLIAEDIRMAVRYLGRITGRTDVEDLLDIIFRDFCIGK